jgi:hypothetical protein
MSDSWVRGAPNHPTEQFLHIFPFFARGGRTLSFVSYMQIEIPEKKSLEWLIQRFPRKLMLAMKRNNYYNGNWQGVPS